MNVIFFEENRTDLLPIVFAKPIAKILIGITTIEEKWSSHLCVANENISYQTENYLSKKFPLKTVQENLYINSSFLPNEEVAHFILNELKSNEALEMNDKIVAAKSSQENFKNYLFENIININDFNLIEITQLTDIFTKNEAVLAADFNRITKNKDSEKLNTTNTLIGNQIFIEKGAKINGAILNSETGPIYIGKNAEIMEGALIRGPFALCDEATLKMGAKIYGGTTIGSYSKVGGEVSNSVIQNFTNKGHDGFLGNSVLGEWCNLGADTNNSNLKNNYSEVHLWNYTDEKAKNTGLQFCGLIMGDHSKCGINTMFNTGTVVGFSANIYGGGFQNKFIPSFHWGGNEASTNYQLEKAMETAAKVMQRRNVDFTDADQQIFTAIYQQTENYRK